MHMVRLSGCDTDNLQSFNHRNIFRWVMGKPVTRCPISCPS